MMSAAPVQDRLDKFIFKDLSGCWIWLGSCDRNGYGVFTYYGKHMAHRFIYEWYVGPIPDGLDLDHLCKNKSCVNPEHVEPVTRQVNIQRKYERRGTCPAGHKYSEQNTHIGSNGYRKCRVCDRERKADDKGSVMAAPYTAGRRQA
jgi:hypothetical protein